MKACSSLMSGDEISLIMKSVDYCGCGNINYTEFLAATLRTKNCMNDQKLWALFKHFDIDDMNYLTPDNIRESFEKAGRKLSKKELTQIMELHDIRKDGKITFEDFKGMMSGTTVDEQTRKFS